MCLRKLITHFSIFFPYILIWILSTKQRKALKKACERYQNLSKEETNKERIYGPEQYTNHTVEERNTKLQML